MSHLQYWFEKIEKGLVFEHEYNSNITKKGFIKNGKDKTPWIKINSQNGEEYFPSGSDWNRDILASVNAMIYLCDMEYIIPSVEINIYDFNQDIINSLIDENIIKNKQWRNIDMRDGFAEVFYTSLEILLNEIEDGDEEHTNDVIKSLLNALGINRKKSPFVSESRHTFHFTVAGIKCKTKPDIVVIQNDKSIVVLFDESKRRIKSSSLQEFFSQIVCHSIGVAQNNIRKGKDQEVFGIAVKDKFWRFCHAIITQDYLNALGSIEPMPKDTFIVQKISEQVFNICNPFERKQIVLAILSILKYSFQEKNLIGNW